MSTTTTTSSKDTQQVIPTGAAYLGATPASLRAASLRTSPREEDAEAGKGYNVRFHQAHSHSTPNSNGNANGHANGDGKTAKPSKKTKALPPRPAGKPGPDHPTGDDAADLGPTVFNPRFLTRRGKVLLPSNVIPAAPSLLGKGKRSTGAGAAKSGKTAKGEHFGLYYELHGSGPVKVLFIMGLNMSCFGWLPQVEHLVRQKQFDPNGKEQGDKYQVLVFDQRGYGNSDVPSGRYTTAQMAQDALNLMAHPDIGWLKPDELVVHPRSAYSTGEPLPSPSPLSSSASSPDATTEAQGSSSTTRKVHLVGVSMGGMITLELLKKYPHLVRSATLISTTSGRARGAADTLLPAAPWEEPPSTSTSTSTPGAQAEEEAQEPEPGTESDPLSPFHLSHLASLPSRKGFLTGLPPLRGVAAIARVMLGRVLGTDSDALRVRKFTELLFPRQWLDTESETVRKANAALRDPHGEFNRPELQFTVRSARDGVQAAERAEGQEEEEEEGTMTNRAWFGHQFIWRYKYTRRQTLPGAFSQIAATMTHRLRNSELHFIDAAMRPGADLEDDLAPSSSGSGSGSGSGSEQEQKQREKRRITILTGDEDHLVNPANSAHLRANLRRSATAIWVQGGGHALPVQFAERVNKTIERTVDAGEELARRGA